MFLDIALERIQDFLYIKSYMCRGHGCNRVHTYMGVIEYIHHMYKALSSILGITKRSNIVKDWEKIIKEEKKIEALKGYQ